MASIAELVRVVASVEGFEENFVSVYARSAREAGYITHHGRGRNAARMTVVDAANLLIAVNASSLAKYVPETIQMFRKLRLPENVASKLSDNKQNEAMAEEGTYFANAIAFLLDRDADGALNIDKITHSDFYGTIPAPPFHPKFNPNPGKPIIYQKRGNVTIDFLGPQPGGNITIENYEACESNTSTLVEFLRCRYRNVDRNIEDMSSDRTVTTSITSDTLWQVAEIINT